MRETQFLICLVATIVLILPVFLLIYLLRKRLPTIQKKIFFAQVWLASMIVVLMPLYYHFYKVAMYYSLSLFLYALTIIGFAIIYYLSPDSDNPNIAYFESFISFNSFLLGIGLFITNIILSYSYYVHGTDENWYGFLVSFLILTIFTFYLIPLPQFYVKIRRYTFIKFYSIFILLAILLRIYIEKNIFEKSVFYNVLSYIIQNLLIFIIPICILFCVISIYMINKNSLIKKKYLVINFINVITNVTFMGIMSKLKYEYYESLPSDLNIWNFVLISVLNTSMLIPYILMSHTIIFTPNPKENNSDQPAQINHEPTP
jgi:hypothetical protein